MTVAGTGPECARRASGRGCGAAHTTFSTFAQETLDLLETEEVGVAFVYALGSLAAGVAAVLVGTAVGRTL
jgi:fluoride ion exporter CrcB/FEX